MTDVGLMQEEGTPLAIDPAGARRHLVPDKRTPP